MKRWKVRKFVAIASQRHDISKRAKITHFQTAWLTILKLIGNLYCRSNKSKLPIRRALVEIQKKIDIFWIDWEDWLARYRRLIGKLIYLTVAKPDITFTLEVLSRFMHQLRETHLLATIRVLAYIKSCPGKGLVYRKHGHVRISE